MTEPLIHKIGKEISEQESVDLEDFKFLRCENCGALMTTYVYCQVPSCPWTDEKVKEAYSRRKD